MTHLKTLPLEITLEIVLCLEGKDSEVGDDFEEDRIKVDQK